LVDGVTIDVSGYFDIPGFVTGFIDVEKPGTDCSNIVEYVAAVGTAPANIQGDVDCSGGVDAVDALKVLRKVVGLPVTQNEPCRDIGT